MGCGCAAPYIELEREMKYRLIAIAAFFVASVASANVIFPAFAAPYMSVVIFHIALFAILGSEAFVYRIFSKQLSIPATLSLVIGVNIVSSAVGLVIATFLPSGLVQNPENRIMQAGPDFSFYAVLGFVLAYFLSIALEAGVLFLAGRRLPVVRPLVTSAIANTVSYALLALIVWVQL